MKVLGVIPARFESKRLPGKILRDICGKPMLKWVYERAHSSQFLTDLLVATDSERVRKWCEDENVPVIVTGEHPCGSDRVYEVMCRTPADIYANIQGDEPTLRPEHIDLLLSPLLSESGVQVTTLKVAINTEAAQDPNNVKVVTADDGRALYFSRCPIPYDRDAEGRARYHKHIGLYAYTRDALATFHSLPQSSLELTERLEQLRLLQNGVPIHVVETAYDTIGVDTEADLERAAKLLAASPDVA